MKASMFGLALVSAMAATGASGASESIVTTCDVRYELAKGQEYTFKFNSRPKQGESYVILEEELPLAEGAGSLYVYYDGEYSAINVGAGGLYYDADSEVEVGKLFSLVHRDDNEDVKVFRWISVACTSQVIETK